MSSPKIDRCDFAVGTFAQTIPESQTQRAVKSVPDASLTARAVVLVAALGGGVWCVLWKISVYLLAGH